MLVIETPGTSTGTSTAASIAASPATWSLGEVPLNMALHPTWTLRNTVSDVVTVGEPHAQVNRFLPPRICSCRTTTQQPGGRTSFNFELSMHPKMDGPHDITVHVPVMHADSRTGTVDVSVTGNFHD